MTMQSLALLAPSWSSLLALAWPLGHACWRASATAAPSPAWAGWRGVERLLYRAAGVAPDIDMGWKAYAVALLVFNGIGALFVFALQRLQAWLPLNPQALGQCQPGLVVQYRGQLRHQHQLAGLRRRADHELPDPDAGADGPELLLGRHRHGRRLCPDPRLRVALGQDHRQLLGRPDPLDPVRAAAAVAAVFRCS